MLITCPIYLTLAIPRGKKSFMPYNSIRNAPFPPTCINPFHNLHILFLNDELREEIIGPLSAIFKAEKDMLCQMRKFNSDFKDMVMRDNGRRCVRGGHHKFDSSSSQRSSLFLVTLICSDLPSFLILYETVLEG